MIGPRFELSPSYGKSETKNHGVNKYSVFPKIRKQRLVIIYHLLDTVSHRLNREENPNYSDRNQETIIGNILFSP